MKLYEKSKHGLNVYDYTINHEKLREYKSSELESISPEERIYMARATGSQFLKMTNACVPDSFLNCTYFEGPEKEVYHEFKAQIDPDTKSIMGKYLSSLLPMYGTIHVITSPEEYYIKTEGYTLEKGVYQMNNIIKVPKTLYTLESLLSESEMPSYELCEEFAFLYDLSTPAFFDDALVQSMLSSGLITSEMIHEKIEHSGPILNLKRGNK